MGRPIGDETVAFEGRIEFSTEKAILIDRTIGEQIWVPRRQIVSMEEIDGDGNREFVVTEWFAKKEGL